MPDRRPSHPAAGEPGGRHRGLPYTDSFIRQNPEGRHRGLPLER